MESRRQVFKPEEDFELQHQDLIHKIQGIEIKELPASFEKHLFAYLLNTRPRKINPESFLEFLTKEIKNATYSTFNNLIGFLINFINFNPLYDEKDEEGMVPSPIINFCKAPYPIDIEDIGPEQEFFAELLSKLKSDLTFQKILKEDKILSDKIRIALSELEFSTNQIEQVEPFLFKTK